MGVWGWGGGESGTAAAPAAHAPSPGPSPGPSPEGEGEETRLVAGWVLDQILVMLHPLMPFVTEELWHAMGERPYELIVAKWPRPEAAVDAEAKREVEWLIDIVKAVRSGRSELNVPSHAQPKFIMSITHCNGGLLDRMGRNRSAFERAARVILAGLRPLPGDNSRSAQPWDEIAQETGESMKRGSLAISFDGFEAFIPLEGVVDIASEKARLAKSRDTSLKERDTLAKRLANPAFVDKAKPEAVAKARADHAHHAAEAERLAAALARLG
ncbi:MAG: class I tRNA ligase family protein [Novosphingobium sp.]